MSATPRPWKLVQYSTGLYVVDATGRTMAVAAVDRADQGKAVDEIRASLAVAVQAVNTFDEAKKFIKSFVRAQELGIEPLATEARIEKAKAVLAELEKEGAP